MAAPVNKGNLITRRAFSGDNFERSHRMPELRRVVNKKMSTAYQMTEEVGAFGSGSPSPLHMVCELIRECEAMDRKEDCEISTAQELARYPLTFLSQLRGEVALDGDAINKINLLLKNASDANYQLRGRDLKDLPPVELKEFGQKVLNVCSIAHELGMMTDAQLMAVESSYPGAPIQGERALQHSGE
jgi:hypothetical protein